jgi:predicted O-methyltransferase YrrM
VQPDAIAKRALALQATQKEAELAELVALVAERRPRTVVEIGTQHGGTFYAWCRTAHPDATLVSIDLPDGPFGGVDRPDLPQVLRGFAHSRQAVHSLRLDSQEPATRAALEGHLAGQPIEFLFIDGDHSFDGVSRDFELYAPLVAPGGLIALHDIVEHPDYPVCQVDRLWRRLRDEYRHVEFIVPGHERGWGPWAGIGALFVD